MPVQTSHDKPYPTAPRADELPEGTPGPSRTESPSDRGPGGKFTRGNSLARAGGKATAGKTKLAARLGLRGIPAGSDFAPYKAAATAFRKAQCSELARTVGGGVCGPAPSSMVASAALQLAWSRYLSDRAAAEGDPAMALSASRLADASRNNLLSAHELCAREAESRPRGRGDLQARLLGIPTEKTKP